MDLKEQVEGFQEAVPLMISAIAAALTPPPPTLHLAFWKEKHHEEPKKHPFGPEVPQLVLTLTLELHPRKLTGWQLPFTQDRKSVV